MSSAFAGDRALVLGGGGIAGIAWESGVLTALLEAGVDLDAADLVVGTSAGSVVATLLRSGGLHPEHIGQLLAATAQPDESPDALAATVHPDNEAAGDVEAVSAGSAETFDGERFTRMLEDIAAAATSDRDARARLGAVARDLPVSLTEDGWIAQMRSVLPADWPQGRLAVTAVDATSGDPHVFDRDSGVDLARAVAASCTVPGAYPLVDIDGHPFMDGGMRSPTNADIAAGHRRVLVVACSEEAPFSPYGMTLPQALDELRRGSEVLLVQADADSVRAFGANTLDAASSGPSFAAGRAQGAAWVERVCEFWGAGLS